jgi:hypothetical protein
VVQNKAKKSGEVEKIKEKTFLIAILQTIKGENDYPFRRHGNTKAVGGTETSVRGGRRRAEYNR